MALLSSRIRLDSPVPRYGPTTPFDESQGLGCFGFARHYSRNHYCFLFLRLLRCFSSAGCLPPAYAGECHGINHDRFSHSEIPGSKLFWQLPEAYRSQSRPSSTCSAKASTMCRNNLINSQLDKQESSRQSGIYFYLLFCASAQPPSGGNFQGSHSLWNKKRTSSVRFLALDGKYLFLCNKNPFQGWRDIIEDR